MAVKTTLPLHRPWWTIWNREIYCRVQTASDRTRKKHHHCCILCSVVTSGNVQKLNPHVWILSQGQWSDTGSVYVVRYYKDGCLHISEKQTCSSLPQACVCPNVSSAGGRVLYWRMGGQVLFLAFVLFQPYWTFWGNFSIIPLKGLRTTVNLVYYQKPWTCAGLFAATVFELIECSV